MKLHLYCLFLMFPTYVFSQGHSYDDLDSLRGSKVKHIIIASVSRGTTTVISISCDAFLDQFKGHLKVGLITNTDSLGTIDKFLKDASFKRKFEDVDVRCELLYVVNGEIQTTICIGINGIILDGRTIKTNKRFMNYLSSMIWHDRII